MKGSIVVAWRALEEASKSDRQLNDFARGDDNLSASRENITHLQRVASLECTPNEYGGEGHHITRSARSAMAKGLGKRDEHPSRHETIGGKRDRREVWIDFGHDELLQGATPWHRVGYRWGGRRYGGGESSLCCLCCGGMGQWRSGGHAAGGTP